MPVRKPAALIEERIAAIARYHQTSHARRAELDISGGVDSALVLGLLSHAIGPDRVTAVYSSINSSQASLELAREAADAFGVRLIELDLSGVFGSLVGELKRGLIQAGYPASQIEADIASDPAILGSLRSCLRAPVGRGLNRMTRGGIRHGTGNECEDRFIRFYQKGGDGEVDTNPINMLSKGEVYQLARELGVPHSILDALPTPDLHGIGEQHNDEAELLALTGVPWTYSRIDTSSGEYRCIGTIEAMSRFLDRPGIEPLLFGTQAPTEVQVNALVDIASRFEFSPLAEEPHRIEALLLSARRMEANTRHKFNPSASGIGSRAALLSSDILDNTLPNAPLACALPTGA